MKSDNYVHGYSPRESERLYDQANTLEKLLHYDSIFSKGAHILEAGCGTGAQTKIIAALNPECLFTSIDISPESVQKARELVRELAITNVDFSVGNILDLAYKDESFDHVFVCFVLEHLPSPVEALQKLHRLLRTGGSLTLIEGDHGSTYFHPSSADAEKAIHAQVELQAQAGGNALIGRQLYPLMKQAGFKNCEVSPRMVYTDSSRPELVTGFTQNTFIAMIEGVRDTAIAAHIIDEQTFFKGIQDLYRTTEEDGVFCYTFFKGFGYKGTSI